MERQDLSPEKVDSPLDKLLHLVEEGDPGTILAEKNLVSTFNELMKYGLIALKDEKVYLTERGKIAKEEGVENFINKLEQEQAENAPRNQPKKTAVIKPIFLTEKKKVLSLSLLLLLLMAMFFSLINFME